MLITQLKIPAIKTSEIFVNLYKLKGKLRCTCKIFMGVTPDKVKNPTMYNALKERLCEALCNSIAFSIVPFPIFWSA